MSAATDTPIRRSGPAKRWGAALNAKVSDGMREALDGECAVRAKARGVERVEQAEVCRELMAAWLPVAMALHPVPDPPARLKAGWGSLLNFQVPVGLRQAVDAECVRRGIARGTTDPAPVSEIVREVIAAGLKALDWEWDE